MSNVPTYHTERGIIKSGFMLYNTTNSMKWTNSSKDEVGIVTHIFLSFTWETEAGGSLSLMPTWST